MTRGHGIEVHDHIIVGKQGHPSLKGLKNDIEVANLPFAIVGFCRYRDYDTRHVDGAIF